MKKQLTFVLCGLAAYSVAVAVVSKNYMWGWLEKLCVCGGVLHSATAWYLIGFVAASVVSAIVVRQWRVA